MTKAGGRVWAGSRADLRKPLTIPYCEEAIRQHPRNSINFEKIMVSMNTVAFAIGTGRCGTKFIFRVMEKERLVSASHERNPMNEAFHRYCKWYGIPVDDEGFLTLKSHEIQCDLADRKFSFEASAHLALSVRELFDRFNSKFILLVRRPEDVVNSYLRKGWYESPYFRSNANLPPSYQLSALPHHFFGRIVPSGANYRTWEAMSRVGKLAWYWNALNARIVEQFSTLPQNVATVQRLEDFTFSEYQRIANFLNISSTVSQSDFAAIAASRPNALDDIPTVSSWGETEIQEFCREVAPMAEHFGYAFDAERLRHSARSKRDEQAEQTEQHRPYHDDAARHKGPVESWLRARLGKYGIG